MPDRSVSFAGIRDLLLVLATAVVAFGFGAASAGIDVDSSAAPTASAVSLASAAGEDTAQPQEKSVSAASSLWAAPDRVAAVVSAAPASRTRAGGSTPRGRFSGEGAGRKGASAARDPYNRRSYILDTPR